MAHVRRIVTTVKNEQKVRDRRELLISAAIKVFLRKGFESTTVREIGAAAGLTQGTIYNYVRSKDDILYLVCDQAITDYEDAVRRALAANPASSRLEATIRAIVGAVYAHQDEILVLHHVSVSLDRKSLKAILARIDRFNSFVAEILDSKIGKGLAPINRRLAVNIITFLPSIVALRRWDLASRVRFEELREGLTSFIARGLGLDEERVQSIVDEPQRVTKVV